MPDPSVVPWWPCWIGLSLFAVCWITGLLFWCNDKKVPRAVWSGMLVLAVVGWGLFLTPPLVNGSVFLAKAFIETAQSPQ